MIRVHLSRSTTPPDITGRAFAVVAPGYDPPQGVEAVPLAEIEADPARWLGSPGTMIVVGLSRMMTPSNRVRLEPVLHQPWAGVQRISVDEVLFVAEPWRAFWHFIATGTPYEYYTDSFRAESRWLRAREQQTADPFDLDTIAKWGRGHVRAVDPFVFGPVVEQVIPCERDTLEEYAAEKEAAFAEETTIAAIVRRLSRFAAEVEPRRSIPTRAALFRRRAGLVPEPVRIVRTDLGVDRFLAADVRHLVTLTNGIAEVFA